MLPLATRTFGAALADVDPASTPRATVAGRPKEIVDLADTPDAAVWLVDAGPEAGEQEVTTVLVDGRWLVDALLPVDEDHG